MVVKTSGNVLLRQAQYETVRDKDKATAIARNIVAGKVKNARQRWRARIETGRTRLLKRYTQ